MLTVFFFILDLFDFLYRKDTLRNEGLSLEFATILFQAWMTNERGIAHISSSLRKVHMENRLLVFHYDS